MASSPPENRRTAIIAICFAVPLLVIFAALNSYQLSARNAERFPDSYGVSRAQSRFTPVLDRVPPTAELGYVTDLEESNAAYGAAFLAAQYVLAPRQLSILGKGSSPEWALGNFAAPREYAAIAAPYGFVPVIDFGNGVVLFRRKQL